ncbi:hypothetical protein [Alkaliphilus hydrothermalis]|uniref:Aminodeoxychorismate lyase n=1 Tax=Alkaliphilus hydrothermalis TaxID=1482730 RepID=A0ABS2NPD6_9FIRM|nr:hypothetical protein [Alkaliphilus hydrothermalis]MBM7614439.1 hypothetical protein [Alkaliphilus hydrothermalis]
MEKLKDLLHDLTDVILAIGIVVVMFTVVTMNLGDWFSGDSAVVFANSTPQVNIAGSEDQNKDEANIEDTEREVVEETEEVTKEVTEKPVDNSSKQSTKESKPKESTEEKPAVITVVDVKKVTIPDGTPGVNIAKILQEKGLIEEPAEFIKVAEDLKLALKLKSGTFDIPTNSTVKEMVEIIARVK